MRSGLPFSQDGLQATSAPSDRMAPFWRTAALLAAASVLYCLPLFSNLGNAGREDWDQYTFRYETPRVSLLRDHVLPTWNPDANGGTVLFAHPYSPVLSPWYAIVLFLGVPIGLRVQVVVFMAVGAVGMAALVARLGATRAGSVAGGIVFMMSSYFSLHIAEGHLDWSVLGVMPWVALCLLRLHEGVRYLIAAALLLASVLTFGAVYIPAVFIPCFSVWVIFSALRARQWHLPIRWAAVVTIAVLLASVKLLPAAQFASDMPRAIEPDLHRTPGRLLLAGLFDPRQAYLYQARRDRDLPDGHVAKTVPAAAAAPVLQFLDALGVLEGFHEHGCYIGLIGLPLAIWGCLGTFRRLWPLYMAGAFALIVVLGSNAPVDLWAAIRHLPLYGQLQVPSRFLAAVAFVLAVTAALGLSAITARIPAPWRSALAVVVVVALYAELLVMGWRLFGDVFVVPPVRVETHADFAQRFTVPSLSPGVMTRTWRGVPAKQFRDARRLREPLRSPGTGAGRRRPRLSRRGIPRNRRDSPDPPLDHVESNCGGGTWGAGQLDPQSELLQGMDGTSAHGGRRR